MAAALAMTLAAATADVAALAGPGPVGDPRDAHGPLDIAGVALAQDGGVLALTVRLRGIAPLSALGVPGRSLCLRLGAAADGAAVGEVCVRARPAGPGLEYRRLDANRPSVGRITGRVLHPDPDTVVVRLHAADAALAPGPFGWSVRTTWRGAGPCAPRPDQPRGCVDRAPDSGTLPANLVSLPAAAGCAPAGAELRAHGSRDAPAVALTFDDGPGVSTPAILAALEREHAPATFFVVGEHVAGHERVLQRMLHDGDAIGDHSFTHADLAKGGVSARVQIEQTKLAIQRATGYVPCLFRAPFGDVSPALLNDARAAGLLTVGWDVDPRDWSLPGPGHILATVLAQARDGSIVLMHDGGGPREQTGQALPAVIQTLRARGLQLVTVPQLLGLRPPTARQRDRLHTHRHLLVPPRAGAKAAATRSSSPASATDERSTGSTVAPTSWSSSAGVAA